MSMHIITGEVILMDDAQTLVEATGEVVASIKGGTMQIIDPGVRSKTGLKWVKREE